ncbi:ATP-binding protein [Candidatus Latescibacterota bacterium]
MFEGIIGQENAKKVLGSMTASSAIPHALLFTGPYGVGKSETAFELARILLCENGLDSGCMTCSSCRRASKLEHPDLHVLFPYKAQPKKADDYGKWVDGLVEHKKLLANEPYAPVIYEKRRQIVVSLVSEVHQRLFETSLEGGRRVCVILSADKLNDKTANSLLKILEEPPGGVYFILTTERLNSVLPTIVSRASIVRFRRLQVQEIADYLGEKGVDEQGKRLCAAAADGSLKTAKALAFSDKAEIMSRSSDIYTSVALGDPDEVITHSFPYMWSRDYSEAEELVNGFALTTRSVLEKMIGMNIRENTNADIVESLSRLTDIQALHRLSTTIEEGLGMLGRNVNISLVLTTLLYEINDTYRKKQSGKPQNNRL